MKRKTVKILLKTTANEVENLRNRIDEAELKISKLLEQQQQNQDCLLSIQKLADDSNQKVVALLKSSAVTEVAPTKENQKVDRLDLESRDKEFIRKISIIKQAQAIIRAKCEEQKNRKKNVWQKLLPSWVGK